MRHKTKMLLIAGICIALLIPVLTFDVFWSVFLSRVMGNVLLTVAAWALLEVAGQPVFGISALAGVGVYGYAMIAQSGMVSPWLALVLGVLIATGVGMLLSIPSMKIGGVMNQGILNIFFVFAFFAFVAAFSKYTGGTAGITMPVLPPEDFFREIPYKYLVIVLITVGCLFAIYRILKSRTGNIISLTAQNERLAETLEIKTTKYKRMAYLLFIPFVAIAGFCISYATGFSSPSTWSVEMAFITILSFWIGGSKSIAGPIIGSALITSIPTLFNVAMEWRIVICGILALVIRMFMPEGIVGLLEKLGKAIDKKRAGGKTISEMESRSVTDR